EVMQDELLRIWEETHKTIVFVTHSIEEAVGLADRVAVMTENPGTIKEIIDINLPRPRRIGDVRNSSDFSWITHKVWELLQNTQIKSKSTIKSNIDLAKEISSSVTI
ncbi:MAG: ABC transporter ATP-binding protein, partial [Ruminiclostridium sp.]